jgi:hypothetical protein
MGACISSPDEDAVRDRTLHREAEKLLKEVCSQIFIHPSVAIIGARWLGFLTNSTFSGKDKDGFSGQGKFLNFTTRSDNFTHRSTRCYS